VITRDDLSPGYQLTQSAHATTQWAIDYPEEAAIWAENSSVLVALAVPDEDTLLEIADRFTGYCAIDQNIDAQWTLFHEPDINEHTAIATLLSEEQWHCFVELPLALLDTSDPRWNREHEIQNVLRSLSNGEGVKK